jgi:hypothetical protein
LPIADCVLTKASGLAGFQLGALLESLIFFKPRNRQSAIENRQWLWRWAEADLPTWLVLGPQERGISPSNVVI